MRLPTLDLAVCIMVGLLCPTLASRILVICPVPMKSHANLVDVLVVELASRGHHVTYVTPIPLESPPTNVTVISQLDNFVAWIKYFTHHGGVFTFQSIVKFFQILTVSTLSSFLNRKFLEEPKVQELISSNLHFDLVIGEAHFDESILAGFSHKFQAPFIGLSTFMASPMSSNLVGNPSPPSYIPHPLAPLPTKMTFCDRLINVLCNIASDIGYTLIGLTLHDRVMREFFGEDLPPLRDIIRNASLVLVNHHYGLSFPRPYLPNMVEIGGFHVRQAKPLPQDLEKYMNESVHGVVLFSLGSQIQSSEMAESTVQALLQAFSKLKENVLWKFERELENLPKNVKIAKWIPQADLLAHKRTRLLITHGGLLSITEAVHRGVPIVGIPVMSDQPMNMVQVQDAGIGKYINYKDITSDLVFQIVQEVLDNPSYKEAIHLRSAILQDTLVPPIETAMYWIEYVIRHKGAPHLRSAAQDLAWYQLYLLDVIAVLAILISFVLLGVFYVIRCTGRLIFKLSKPGKSKQS